MPVEVQGKVGPPTSGSLGLGALADPRLGGGGEAIVSEFHGKYYEQNYRGNLYIASSPAAGAAIPAFSTAAQQFLVWNPPGSGVNCVPVRAIIGYVSAADAPGHLCIGHSLTVQAQPGTTTLASIFPAKIGAIGPGKVQVYTPGSPATVLTYHSPLDLSFETAVAASTNAPFKSAHEFDGTLICPPGGLFSIAGNIALTAVCAIALIYEEVPT